VIAINSVHNNFVKNQFGTYLPRDAKNKFSILAFLNLRLKVFMFSRLSKYLYLSITMFIAMSSYGQQSPAFTQYSSAYMFINAGYAGMGQGICVSALARQQWAGFKDAEGNKVSPQDFLINADAPIKAIQGGVGGSIIQDKLGFETNVGIRLAYSYHLQTSAGILGMGAGINLVNRSIDFTKFHPVQPNDPALLNAKAGAMIFDGNIGFFFKSNNNYYVGLSATNILESKGKNLSTSGTTIRYQTDRTFYLMAGYSLVLPNHPLFEIVPSLLIQSDVVSTQYNISAIVNYNSKFWGGVNYRFQESVGFMVGVNFQGFRFGYSYDLSTLSMGVPGSHEITLRYCFKIKVNKNKTRYKNTRFL
jgi:type IX secretion system PorP/SprF family membrane protein